MKKSTRIIGTALATMMVASTLAVGGVSASAASVKKPTSVKAKNTAKGIKITWKKVKGAKKYRVYRGKKKLTATKKTTYTDKKAKAGKTYKYTVKAVKGKKVKGAKKYYVYSGTTKVATTTKLNYTYTKAVSGKTYSFKVKAVNGKSTSVASAAKKGAFLAAPVGTAKAEGNKVTVTWDKVEGATEYQLGVATIVNSEYVDLGTTKETSFTYEIGVNPTLYIFKVVAVNGSAKSGDGGAIYTSIPEGSYVTDKDGNLHVNITLKKGESYKEGAYLVTMLAITDAFTAQNSYAVSVDDESAKVISVKDGIITGNAEGKGTVKVELKTAEVQSMIYDNVCQIAGKKFGNELKTGVVFVDVTVEA